MSCRAGTTDLSSIRTKGSAQSGEMSYSETLLPSIAELDSFLECIVLACLALTAFAAPFPR